MSVDAESLRDSWPAQLHGEKVYLPFVLRERPGSARLGKVPARFAGGRWYPCDVRDRQHHLTLDEALEQLDLGADGVGIALDETRPLLHDLPLVALDLDEVLDGDQLDPRAEGIVRQLASYTETSHSGRGLHVVVAADTPAGPRRGDGWELISSGFMALGRRWPGSPTRIEPRTRELQELHASLVRDRHPPPRAPALAVESPGDHEVLGRLRSGPAAGKFIALYEQGCLDLHCGDASRADAALIALLARATREPAQLARLALSSALARPERWGANAGRGMNYLERTIEFVLSTTTGSSGGSQPR